jgi:hypothetical protein
MCERAQDLSHDARGRLDVAPYTAGVDRNSGQRESGVAEGVEVGLIERTALLAGCSIGCERF